MGFPRIHVRGKIVKALIKKQFIYAEERNGFEILAKHQTDFVTFSCKVP